MALSADFASNDNINMNELMKVVIPGGSGQVGTLLARHLHQQGREVVVLSRKTRPTAWRTVQWDGKTKGAWCDEIDGADVVINLAGRSVDCRYHATNRQAILDSRVDSTRIIGRAIAAASRPPHTWLQMSTATIYAHRLDQPNDEATGILGGDEPNAPDTWRFSIDVAKAWEKAAQESLTPQTRKVIMRSAMVMSPDKGGVFDTLLRLVRLRLGGRVGNGRQFVSWVHDADFIRSIEWLIANQQIEGVVNIASPNPLPYNQFMHALRQARGVHFGLPAMKWMVEIGSFFMRTESELILKSRRVIPSRLLAEGFEFDFPMWTPAAHDLVGRWGESAD